MKQTLESKFSTGLKKAEILYTRLRTPNYGFRGVRYPADFVVWFPSGTALVECKQRKSLPIAPSDIRQMPFIEGWHKAWYVPHANYYILVKSEEEGRYYVFSSETALKSKNSHKSMKKEEALISSDKISDIVSLMMEECKWQS